MISTRRPAGRHRHHLGGRASRFTALVGIDDFCTNQSPAGAARAVVRADGRTLLTTATLTGATGPTAIDLDGSGVRLLHLLVEDANATPPSTTPPGPAPTSRPADRGRPVPGPADHSAAATPIGQETPVPPMPQ
ncbi:NPCBM/NEW2 domain-containing protein [Streptomyces avidinii]|uniref:NPCBM/NEW2 domain-containing protein n=1 Tax=Streptomyces avidinii TaxID=1895 RepID=UPI00386F3E3E|nr:NPCBM/NEW2 domain-containing protein [Streptomyces avidinii]